MSLRTIICCALLPSATLMAGDFWLDKQPAQWTDKEINKLRTNSPWAHDASVEFNLGRMGGMESGSGEGRGRGGGMGPGGGMGSGGGMGPGGGGPPPDMGSGGPGGGMGNPKLIVRWESGPPLLEAAGRDQNGEATQKIAGWAREFYVVSVSGLSGPNGRRGGGPANDGTGRPGQMGPPGMKEGTSLKRKGKESIIPARVESIQTEKGATIVFLFPRADAIDGDDKEVTFETGLGPLGVKCKFVLKDMRYKGSLAL